MMCKTGILRLISALAVCTVVAGASAQSPPSSFELQAPLFSHNGLGFEATYGSSFEKGFSTARGQVFLLDADRALVGTGLSAPQPAAASDWGDRIKSANTYSLSSPGQYDDHNHADMQTIYIVGGIVIVGAILLLVMN